MFPISGEVKVVKYNVSLQTFGVVRINEIYEIGIAGETINDGQVVKKIDGKYYVAKATDSDFDNLIGVAVESVRENDVVRILQSGKLIRFSTDEGLLFLGSDGYPTRFYDASLNYVLIGVQINSNTAIIFSNKECIIRED